MGTGKIILIIALIVIALAAVVAAVIIWRNASTRDPAGDSTDSASELSETSGRSKRGKITSVESFLLHLSGMRLTSEYEIACDGGTATVSLYYFNYATGEEKRVLEQSASVDTATLLEKLNSFRVADWDGFDGPHPKGVTDGTQFTLEATVNGSDRIYAHGSQNFPKHYHDLTDWLKELLKD